MRIELNKFGVLLMSRPSGREAWLAYQPTLRTTGADEAIEVDVLGPSWADEFITPLVEQYATRVTLHNTDNPSVQATLEVLKLKCTPSPEKE